MCKFIAMTTINFGPEHDPQSISFYQEITEERYEYWKSMGTPFLTDPNSYHITNECSVIKIEA